MRQERFKMEREGLVTEGQEVEISERSAVTGQFTYLVEPSIAMSGFTVPVNGSWHAEGSLKRLKRRKKGFISS